MTTIPITQTLGIRRRVPGPKDEHGDVTETLSAAEEWPVHAVAPGAMIEPGEPQRDASHVLWTVYAPPTGPRPGARDVIVYHGIEYAVDAEPKPYNEGPWEFSDAGIVVALKKVLG